MNCLCLIFFKTGVHSVDERGFIAEQFTITRGDLLPPYYAERAARETPSIAAKGVVDRDGHCATQLAFRTSTEMLSVLISYRIPQNMV